MAKKAGNESAVNLDSFLDVLTCLQGILMLVIIATGIDAAQTKVLIPTPIERQSSKKPLYLECRNDLVYPLDVQGLAREARTKMTQATLAAAGDQMKMMQLLTELKVNDDYYEVDLSYYMLGRLAVRPKAEDAAEGFALDEQSTFSTDNFMVRTLKNMDPEAERIVLLVRDDSFTVFKVAQRLSFLAKVEISVEIYDLRELLWFNMSAGLSEG